MSAQPTEQQPPIEELTLAEPAGDATYHWDVPDDWQQGRGAFGGLVICAAVRVLQTSVDDADLALRAINATLCGPVVPGRAVIRVRALRRGSSTFAVTCDVQQDDEIKAHVTAFFGARRVEDADWQTMTAPQMPDWRELTPAPVEPPLGPVFAKHIDFRPTGAFPFSGAETREAIGWVRPKTPSTLRGPEYLALLADAYWPAFYSAVETPRPAATVMFMMEFFEELDPEHGEAPVFFRSSSPVSNGGYAMEQRELWSPDGRLLALNQQSFCIIK